MAIDPDRVERELTEVMNSAAIEEHPFLRALSEGKVPREVLAGLGPSHCYQVEQFKRFVAAIYANAEPRDVRELMLANLWEEHGEGDPSRDHTVLMAKLFRALGAEIPDPYDVEPIPTQRRWVERILEICRSEHFVVGLAALSFGIEARTRTMAFLGEVYRDKYGVSQDDAEFFFMHLETDEEHAGRAIQLVRKYCTTEELLHRCKRAVRAVLDTTLDTADTVRAS